jgi:hypothetical protein
LLQINKDKNFVELIISGVPGVNFEAMTSQMMTKANQHIITGDTYGLTNRVT